MNAVESNFWAQTSVRARHWSRWCAANNADHPSWCHCVPRGADLNVVLLRDGALPQREKWDDAYRNLNGRTAFLDAGFAVLTWMTTPSSS